MLNLIKNQRPDFDKILFILQRFIPIKISIVFNERQKVVIENLKNQKAFIDYSQTNDGFYESLKDYNPAKKMGVLIVFDGMRADMKSNQTWRPIVTEVFLRGKKLDISLAFITMLFQSA